MGSAGKKECIPLKGGTVLSEAASVFLKTGLFSKIIITYTYTGNKALDTKSRISVKNSFYAGSDIKELTKELSVKFVAGGDSRQESVLNALKNIKEEKAVLIHDGARPFLTGALVKKTLSAVKRYGAAVPALQPVETQKEVGADGNICRHLLRKNLAAVQTPQGFKFPEILQYHKMAAKDGGSYTDDTEIWDKYSPAKTRVIEGESGNIKITYPKDIENTSMQEKNSGQKGMEASPNFRIGLGTDLHRLVQGRKLILGGVVLPYDKGEDGHSDGDALLHAITDALLGAAGLGDIGSYFPPAEKKWKDADSAQLLKNVWADVRKSGWSLGNLDCVIQLQSPKFLPFRESVRASIADILGVKKEAVFVKAKTGEHIGPVGLGQVVETEAVCLLVR